MIFQTHVSQLETEVTHLSKLNLLISTGSLKWDLEQSYTPNHTVSALQYLLGLKDIKTKKKNPCCHHIPNTNKGKWQPRFQLSLG